jgi:hypothetical protein
MKNNFYQKEAESVEEQFFGFEGNQFFAVNKDGGEAYGADGYKGAFSADGEGADAVAVEQPDFQRTFTLQIANANAFTVSVELFNAQVNVLSPTFGMPAGVTLTSLESNPQTVYNSTMFMPLQIVGFRFEANPEFANYASQLRQVMQVNKEDMYGVKGTYRVPTNSYISLMQQIDYAVDIKPYRIDITGQSSIAFNLLANQTVTFTFYTGVQVQNANSLHGRPNLGQVVAPLPMSQSQPLTISTSTLNRLAEAMAMGNK